MEDRAARQRVDEGARPTTARALPLDPGSAAPRARRIAGLVEAFLEGLPPRSRELMVLRHEGRLTLHEIGARLGLTRERVRQLVHRALAQPPEALAAEGALLSAELLELLPPGAALPLALVAPVDVLAPWRLELFLALAGLRGLHVWAAAVLTARHPRQLDAILRRAARDARGAPEREARIAALERFGLGDASRLVDEPAVAALFEHRVRPAPRLRPPPPVLPALPERVSDALAAFGRAASSAELLARVVGRRAGSRDELEAALGGAPWAIPLGRDRWLHRAVLGEDRGAFEEAAAALAEDLLGRDPAAPTTSALLLSAAPSDCALHRLARRAFGLRIVAGLLAAHAQLRVESMIIGARARFPTSEALVDAFALELLGPELRSSAVVAARAKRLGADLSRAALEASLARLVADGRARPSGRAFSR